MRASILFSALAFALAACTVESKTDSKDTSGTTDTAGADTTSGDTGQDETTTPTGGPLGSCNFAETPGQCYHFSAAVAASPDASLVKGECTDNGGEWLAGAACPTGYDAWCTDYDDEELVLSAYYYNVAGYDLTEAMDECVNANGEWTSTI